MDHIQHILRKNDAWRNMWSNEYLRTGGGDSAVSDLVNDVDVGLGVVMRTRD